MRLNIHAVCEGVWLIEISFKFRFEYDGQISSSDYKGQIVEPELCFTRKSNGEILHVALKGLCDTCLIFGQINKKMWRGTAYSAEVYERILTTGDYFYTTFKEG